MRSSQSNLDEAEAAPRRFCVARALPADLALRAELRFGPPPGNPSRPAEALLVRSGTGREQLLAALERDVFFTVELSEEEDAQGDWPGAAPVDKGFYLSLTTGTAYGLPCAVVVCDLLVGRGILPAERRSSVELCLHEAIANAILHGNMGIPSSTKDRPEGYLLFSQMIRDRLGDSTVRRLRLDLYVRWDGDTLTIAVLDQGRGFDSADLPHAGGGTGHSGLGFLLMRSLARAVSITDKGRCTVLQFDL